MSVNASIIICTRNRAESLRETLASIAQTQVPRGWQVELLAVDNGSTDHTRQVVEGAQLENIAVRYTLEPKTGQCHARNAGLRETTGDIIMFTDDDVRVPAGWIAGMCHSIVEGRADAVAGGIVVPPHIAYALSKPPLGQLRGWFACSDYLNPEAPDNMIGANMAFHRRILSTVPEFDIALGPGALGFFDEVLFSMRLKAAGYKLTSALDVAVEHHFDLSRLTPESLLNTARRMGQSYAYVYHHWLVRRSRSAHVRLLLAALRRWGHRITERSRGDKRLPTLARLARERELGFYEEYLRQRSSPPRYKDRPAIIPHAAWNDRPSDAQGE